MDLNFFKNNLTKYADLYKPADLFPKIKKVAKKVGVNIVYVVLLLYYASLDKNIPIKDRVMILAALGYFILPVDLIPDALPGGFADDTAAIMFVLRQVYNNLTDDVKQRARTKLTEWFDNVSDDDLKIPGI